MTGTATAKRLLAHDPALLTEAQFSGLVVDVARFGGWKRYHTHDSRRSNHGFPDWVFVKGPRLIFAELKSEVGKVRDDQREWLDALLVIEDALKFKGIGADAWRGEARVEVYVWRPSDYERIVEVLTGKTPVDSREAA